MTAPIRLRGVTKQYGPVTALADVDLTVRPGTLHGLLGPNGSGKTTVLDVLLGLREPTRGRVDRPASSVGCGFQTPTVFPDLTVAENLEVFACARGATEGDWRRRVEGVLDLPAVERRPAGALSDGWRKKLDLALAFLAHPSYAILDEPLDALDDVTVRRLRDFLADYPDGSHGVLVATHRPRQFAPRFDRLTILDGGTVVYDGDPPADRSARALYLDVVEG